jgi:hypothetical protein
VLSLAGVLASCGDTSEGFTCGEMKEPAVRQAQAVVITEQVGVYDLPLSDCDRRCRANFAEGVERDLAKACASSDGDHRPAEQVRESIDEEPPVPR